MTKEETLKSKIGLTSFDFNSNIAVTPNSKLKTGIRYVSKYWSQYGAATDEPYTQQSTLIQTAVFVDRAPCGCSENNPDGKPTDFTILQQSSASVLAPFFKFTWSDGSVCEEKFNFYECFGSVCDIFGSFDSPGVSAPGSTFAQCGASFSPDTDKTKKNIAAGVTPGTIKKFCMRASSSNRQIYASDMVCKEATVKFMAKIAGTVTRNSDSKGVKGVGFTWHLKDNTSVNGTADVISDVDGSFDFDVTLDDVVAETVTIMICPEKNSAGVEHQFKFNTVLVECAQTNIQHLAIKPVSFQDVSEFIVSGRVIFDEEQFLPKFPKDLSNPDLEATMSNCRSSNVTVCTYNLEQTGEEREESKICTETDTDGHYELSIVTESQVRISPNYGNHTFALANDLDLPYFDIKGASGDVEDLIFHDTTSTIVKASLFGGKCEKKLGTFKLKIVSTDGCFSYEVFQEGKSHDYTLPSLDYNFFIQQVDSNVGKTISGDAVLAFFDNTKKKSKFFTAKTIPYFFVNAQN